jgi:hypothetical protein
MRGVFSFRFSQFFGLYCEHNLFHAVKILSKYGFVNVELSITPTRLIFFKRTLGRVSSYNSNQKSPQQGTQHNGHIEGFSRIRRALHLKLIDAAFVPGASRANWKEIVRVREPKFCRFLVNLFSSALALSPNYFKKEYRGGKNNLGKILFEISGQYFHQDFKPRDRIFPAIFKKSSISSIYRLKI